MTHIPGSKAVDLKALTIEMFCNVILYQSSYFLGFQTSREKEMDLVIHKRISMGWQGQEKASSGPRRCLNW